MKVMCISSLSSTLLNTDIDRSKPQDGCKNEDGVPYFSDDDLENDYQKDVKLKFL